MALAYPKTLVAAAGIIAVVGLWPIPELGRELMPELDEGNLMYTCPPPCRPSRRERPKEVMKRAAARPTVVVSMTLAIIVLCT